MVPLSFQSCLISSSTRIKGEIRSLIRSYVSPNAPCSYNIGQSGSVYDVCNSVANWFLKALWACSVHVWWAPSINYAPILMFCVTRSNVTIFKCGCFLVRTLPNVALEGQKMSLIICDVSWDWSLQLELKAIPELIWSSEKKELVCFVTVRGRITASVAGKKAIRSPGTRT